MNILIDIIIIAILIGAWRGWKYGGITAAVNLVSTIVIFVISYYLKNPIAVYMFENLPFIKFGGIFEGISSLNILFYEALAYLISMLLLLCIVGIILKVTHLLDKLVKMTLIFALPSKIIGLFLGALQYYVIIYFIVFVMLQIPFTGKYLGESNVVHTIVNKTPALSNITNELYTTYNEVYDVCKKNDDEEDKEKIDYDSLDVLMKHKIITSDSVQKLKEKNKIEIENVDELIEKYKDK